MTGRSDRAVDKPEGLSPPASRRWRRGQPRADDDPSHTNIEAVAFLNMILAVEAIVLSSFLLMAQDRMTREADRRDHLNLQIDLLAEQELTAILNVVVALAERAGIDVKNDLPEIERLRARTDVHKIAATLERQMEASKRGASSVDSDPAS